MDEKAEQQEEAEYYNKEGIGRIYECVFCKRGFNTAQALGGHMNIHRKHKITSNKPSTIINHQIQINHHLLSGANNVRGNHVAETESSYVTYFRAAPASTSTNNGHHNNNVECLNLFGDDQWGLQIGNTAAAHDHVIQNIEKKGTQEDYLDLELRLGHHPLKQ